MHPRSKGNEPAISLSPAPLQRANPSYHSPLVATLVGMPLVLPTLPGVDAAMEDSGLAERRQVMKLVRGGQGHTDEDVAFSAWVVLCCFVGMVMCILLAVLLG